MGSARGNVPIAGVWVICSMRLSKNGVFRSDLHAFENSEMQFKAALPPSRKCGAARRLASGLPGEAIPHLRLRHKVIVRARGGVPIQTSSAPSRGPGGESEVSF